MRFPVSSAETLLVLPQQELIRHSCDIVAHDNMARFRSRKLLVRSRHGTRLRQVIRKELFQTFHRAVAVFRDRRMIVNMRKQESLQGGVICSSSFAESSKPFGSATNFVNRGCAR